MSRYQLWDRLSDVITPVGEVLKASEWIERYPVAAVIDTVCGGGVVNGSYFGVYQQMIESYSSYGCDFTGCTTKQEHLDAIEAFEDAQNAADDTASTAEERIAAALEAQVMMAMPDEEE